MKPLEPLSWTHLYNGQLAIGHRPKLKRLSRLAEAGITHVVTLLSEKEGAKRVGEAAHNAGMEWIWLPLENGEPPNAKKTEMTRVVFEQLVLELKSGANLYLHCSAGIHRTGMIAYALLRHVGNSREDSLLQLEVLRPHTAAGVGEHRIAWGDQFSWSDRNEHRSRKKTGGND